jgi:1-acyl-sn-glycerol-3-phosphate acyltransferase
VLLAAHRRWGLLVPAVMAAAAALVDKGVIGSHVHVIGYANYLFVWGSIHQWGFSWQDRSLTRVRWRPYALAAGGAALLADLLASHRYMVDMIGSGNTNPPSIALLAYAAAQCGLVIAAEPAEPAAAQLPARPRLWRPVRRLNATTMTVYLWHFVPVIVIAVAFYPTGVMPPPAIGTAQWWGLRLAWFALLTVVLVPLVMAVMWAERPMRRLPAGIGPYGPWSPLLLLAGLAASMFGLARLAIAGFAPGGHLPAAALAACAVGLTATLFTGRAPAARPQPKGGRPSWRTVPTLAAGVLASAAGAVLVWCRGPARADSAVTDRILRWWAGVWLRAAGARVSASGLEQVGAAGPCMIVSNHQSLLDPLVHLHALPVSLRVLAMRELFRIPLFGPAMRAIGMIEVDRESPDFGEIDAEAARALAAGHRLLAYPEGRISPDGSIGEFKDGAFVIAVAAQVPVVPIAVNGTGRIWPPGRRAIHAGPVRMVAGSPLPISGLTHRDVDRLRDQAREVICSAHRDLVAAMEAPAVNGRQRRPSVAR